MKHALAALALFPPLIALSPLAHGFVFTIDSTTDAVDQTAGDGICATVTARCTLRAAIQEANAWPGADTLIVPAGTYTLTLAGTGEDQAITGDLDILEDLTLRGAGVASTIIDGNGIDRLFHIMSDTMVEIRGVTLQNGRTNGGGGGGIANLGNLILRDSIVDNNTAVTTGFFSGIVSGGGGIASGAGSVTIDHSRITNNHSGANSGQNPIALGGGIAIGGTSAGGPNFPGGGGVAGGPRLTITDSVISGNTAASTDGGEGGGLFVNEGVVTITHSTVSGNTADLTGVHDPNNIKQFTIGGGITNFGALTLKGSTVSGNTSTIADGGGIFNAGPGARSGLGTVLTITNSTISGNTAPGGDGGGLLERKDGSTLTHVTLTANQAANGGGIFLSDDPNASPAMTLKNTLVANQAGGGDCSGMVDNTTLTSNGNNLDSDNSCNLASPPDLPGTNPQFDAAGLALNGGPTRTHALQGGSPAIDLVPAGTCPPPASDQRSVDRPNGGMGGVTNCDAGAYERTPSEAIWADLGIHIEDSPDPILAGSPLTYTIMVTNYGPNSATGITLSDSLGSEVIGAANASQGTGCTGVGSASVDCDLGTLTPGSSATVTVQVTPANTGTLTNTASIKAVAQIDLNPANNTAIQETTQVDVPTDVAVSLADAPDPVKANTPLTYTLTVTNIGGPARNVVLTDDPGLPFAVVKTATVTPPPGANCAITIAALITCQLGDLAAGAGAVVTVALEPQSLGTITNTAWVNFTGKDTAPVNNTTSVNSKVVPTSVDLVAAFTAFTASVSQGADLSYTVQATNNGPDAASNVVLAFQLPGGLTFKSFANALISRNCDTITLTCTFTTLAAGDSKTITLFATVSPGAKGNLKTTATVTSSAFDTDSNLANNSASATTAIVVPLVPPAQTDLTLLLNDDPDPATVGQNLLYTLTVRNKGPDSARQVVLTVTLPTSVSFQAGLSSPECAPAATATTLSCDIGFINALGTATVRIVVQSTAAGTITTTASVVNNAGNDPDFSNNSATQDTLVNIIVAAIKRGGGGLTPLDGILLGIFALWLLMRRGGGLGNE